MGSIPILDISFSFFSIFCIFFTFLGTAASALIEYNINPALPPVSPWSISLGSEIDTELTACATASASLKRKAPSAAPEKGKKRSTTILLEDIVKNVTEVFDYSCIAVDGKTTKIDYCYLVLVPSSPLSM